MLLPHDVDVVFRIGGGRKEGLEISQNGRASDLFQKIPVRQGLGDRDQVDRTVLLPEVLKDCVDRSVGRMMKVLLIDSLLDSRGDRILGG